MSNDEESNASVEAAAAFAENFHFEDDDGGKGKKRRKAAAVPSADDLVPTGADAHMLKDLGKEFGKGDGGKKGKANEKGKTKKKGNKRDREELSDEEEEGEKAKFGLEVRGGSHEQAVSWEHMRLSRPLMRAIRESGYSAPTPVQTSAIPYIKEGRDVLASAVTGSGKTAAFLLPVLERLLHRQRSEARTRVLVLSPTRELAVQTYDVLKKLSAFTTVSAAQAIGGLSVKQQEAAVQQRPDIVIGTPGRVVDLAENTRGFGLDSVEVLILDEADRLLDLGFLDEITHIVKACPPHRQTLLFSATMTEQVQKLQVLAMRSDAVRVAVDERFETALGLQQEFVRLREDSHKEAALLALTTRSFTERVIVFAGEKIRAHRLKQLLCLAGLKAVELHGNLSQAQRLESLRAFKESDAEFLVATDVAARGLDVHGVQTVINYDLPATLAAYVHRVGRTARAGAKGCAVSFVGEADRRLFKAVIKSCRANPTSDDTTDARLASASLKQRSIPHAVVAQWGAQIEAWADELQNLTADEQAERRLAETERDATRASNLLEYRADINARPKRAWITSSAQRTETKQKAKDAVMEQKRKASSGKGVHHRAPKEQRMGGRRDQSKALRKEKHSQGGKRKDQGHKRTRQGSAFDTEA